MPLSHYGATWVPLPSSSLIVKPLCFTFKDMTVLSQLAVSQDRLVRKGSGGPTTSTNCVLQSYMPLLFLVLMWKQALAHELPKG